MEDLYPQSKVGVQEVKKQPRLTLEKFGYMLIAVTAFLLPFSFFPSRFVTLEVSKAILLTTGVMLGLFVFLLNVVKSGKFELPRHKLFLGALAVPAVFLLSSYLSSNNQYSLFGYGLDTGSAVFIALGFMFMFLTVMFFRDKSRIFLSYLGALVGIVVVLVFALAKLLFGGEALSFGVIAGMSANLVGAWTDLGAYLGVGVMMIAIAIETVPMNKYKKVALYAVLALALFVMAVVGFGTIWLLLMVFSLIFFVYVVSFDVRESQERRISYVALVILITSVVFYFNPVVSGEGRIGDVLAESFNTANFEIRPSFTTTSGIIASTLKLSPVLGSGPNTFGTEWLTHKPLEVNQSNFWNTRFPNGFALLPTFVATTGILGTLAWLVFFLFYLQLGVRTLFSDASDKMLKFFGTSSFLSSLLLWILAMVYVPRIAVFGLAFFMTGIFVASAVTLKLVDVKSFSFSHNAKLSFVTILVLIGLLVGNATFAYSTLRRSASAVLFQKALVQVGETGDVDTAISTLSKAINVAPYDVYYLALSQAHVAKINRAFGDDSLSDEDKAKVFQESLRASISSAQSATSVNPGNYENWISLAQIYESLILPPIAIEGSYDSAKTAYLEALKRNPHSPEIYLFLARLETINGNVAGAREYIALSLEKKSNYADAYFLLTQIELEENNVSKAIESAELTALLSPSNPGIFFQLGLLKYNAGDFQGAVEALNQAVLLVPDYANAKYFLGLTYYRLDRTDLAIREFKDLAKSQSDNEEVRLILANLESQNEPFAGLPASMSPDLENRESPPIRDN